MKSKRIELDKKNYVERDVSWMYFNYRILREAMKKEVPLYERLSFLGIYSNNLDEFYKVRVASFKRIASSKVKGLGKERKEAKEILDKIIELTEQYGKEFDACKKEVFAQLQKKGVVLIDESQLSEHQKGFIQNYYIRKVSGYIHPILLTKRADLSQVNDSHIYLAVKMTGKDAETAYALVQLPVHITGRFINLGIENGKHYVMYIDDIVRYHLPLVFHGLGYDHFESYAFKFTKDAEMEVESDPEEGLLKSISMAVKERKRGIPVRVILGEGIPEDLKKVLLKRLDVEKDDLISVGGRYHNNKDLMKFPKLSDESLSYPQWESQELSLVREGKSLIERIKAKDLFVHVPYQSFDAFVHFLQECAISPDVDEIKATIYRAAKESQVVYALTNAARNGKKVTAVVELLARFDESSNISISQKLMESGCNVLTGEEGFKIHGKIVYVHFKDGTGISIVSTGNFHEGNAKTYTDCLLFTADKRIVRDVSVLFDFIEQPFRRVNFTNLLVSPDRMQSVFRKLIKNEIKNKENGLPSGIKIKINHITDKEMVKLLYEASSHGVKIDLLVRGNCSLVTGIAGLSDTISVHGIIDRYLEHSRIFIFQNGGNPLYFMGSADWMPRNLYNRIEVIAPVFDRDVQRELERIVDFGLQDNANAVVADGSGRYIPVPRTASRRFRSQEKLHEYYVSKEE